MSVPTEAEPPGLPRDILLVDDNVDSIESLALLLELFGHRVRSVNDGLAALKAADEALPQVVVMDIGMPGIDGYEVARRLRAAYPDAPLMLIALSGYGDADTAQKLGL